MANGQRPSRYEVRREPCPERLRWEKLAQAYQ